MNKAPITIQGLVTQYGGKYPAYYTDGKELFKVIDSTCRANAEELLCKFKNIPHDGTFLNKFKPLQPDCKKHAQIISKLGYKL